MSEPILDKRGVEIAAEAILDLLEEENQARGAFSGEFPREQYREYMCKQAYVGIKAYLEATKSLNLASQPVSSGGTQEPQASGAGESADAHSPSRTLAANGRKAMTEQQEEAIKDLAKDILTLVNDATKPLLEEIEKLRHKCACLQEEIDKDGHSAYQLAVLNWKNIVSTKDATIFKLNQEIGILKQDAYDYGNLITVLEGNLDTKDATIDRLRKALEYIRDWRPVKQGAVPYIDQVRTLKKAAKEALDD